jgi:hypothetical protein
MIRKVVIALAGCALVASLAFAQPRDEQTTKAVTVTGTIITDTQDGVAANYQPLRTLVVRQDNAAKPARYTLNGPGHIVDKRGYLVRNAIQPGAHVRVFYTGNGADRVIDHVLLLD